MSTIDELVQRAVRLGSLRLPGTPRLHLAIVTCMDARIDPLQIFGLERGDAHVLRNGGGVVTDDMLRSLILSQRFLGTREIMLMHHTRCGAHNLRDEEVKAQIEKETGILPPFSFEGFSDLDAAVRRSLRRVRECPFLPHRDGVRGFVLDITIGSLREIR